MEKDKVIVKINFEDHGQDFLYFKISFYPDYKFGEIIEAGPFQQDIWQGFYVLSGKPVVGQRIRISKSPVEKVFLLNHKIESIEFPLLTGAIATSA